MEYEYSLKSNAVKETPSGSGGGYSWTQSAWSDCNSPCGGGTRARQVSCSNLETLQQVDDSLCDPYIKPPHNETCNSTPCKPKWNVGAWGNCTEGNGTDCTQFQFRNVFCEQVLANNVPSLVEDEMCADLGQPPLGVKACDEEIEDDFLLEDETTPRYWSDPWSGCSTICGPGTRTRKVTCYKKTEEGISEVLEDTDCVGSKPATEEECSNPQTCEPHDWVVSDKTECESCGATHTAKHALCTDQTGRQVGEEAEESCEASQAPPLLSQCETPGPDCEFSWFTSQWSLCSSKCSDLRGVKSRRVFCGSMAEDGSITNTTEENCSEEMKYEETEDCYGTEECSGNWYVSTCGTCSEECGPGKCTRKVFCIKDGQPVDPTDCPEDLKPLEEEECDNLCEESGSGNDTATDTGECEYYEDAWIFNRDQEGEETEEDEEEEFDPIQPESRRRRRRRQASDGSGSGDGSGADGGEETEEQEGSGESEGSGTVEDDEAGGNKTKKEIDYSLFSRRCKPEKVEPCANTTYGCCPDGFFAATGAFNEGCMEYTTCQDTRHGCCRDGHTTAQGRNFEGCPKNVCAQTLFGCCDDGETPAEGVGEETKCEENKKCQAGKFGCCPDGRYCRS